MASTPGAASAPSQLCKTCSEIDFKRGFNLFTDRREREENFMSWSHFLGSLKDISSRDDCPFCRLVVKALLARWPDKTCGIQDLVRAKTADNEEVKCTAQSVRAGNVGHKYNATMIAITTNLEVPRGFPYPVSSHGEITALGEDVQNLGLDPLYHARYFGKTIDFARAGEWIQTCETYHTRTCRRIGVEVVQFMPKSLRLIDVQTRCIVPAPKTPRYLALSYVWGRVSTLQLTKATYNDLQQEGYLSADLPNLAQLIKDAIHITSRLGERYLWVDQLCVMQDNPEDVKHQISQMDLVYARAVVTIVAACADNANARLLGLADTPRNVCQESESVAGMRLVVPMPTLPQTLGSSIWNQRAWTFQEYQLSPRRLVVAEQQLYFECQLDTMAEDAVCEAPHSRFSLVQYSDHVHRVQSINRGIRFSRWQWPDTFHDYAVAVELYTARQLSFPDDVLSAFLGLQNILQRTARWNFWHALPEEALDYALLWRPKGELKRRQLTSSASPISSVSWAGWIGAVHLDQRDLISHIPTFEVHRGGESREVPRRMTPASEADGHFATNLMYDMGTERAAVLATVPRMQDIVQKSKRLLGVGFGFGAGTASGDDPAMQEAEQLRFTTSSATFRISRAAIELADAREERVGSNATTIMSSPYDEISAIDRGSRCWIYDGAEPPRRVGVVWKVAAMDEPGFAHDAARFLLLSRSRCSEPERRGTEWKSDPAVGAWGEWCMLNVMLVAAASAGSNDGDASTPLQRVSIGEIHEAAWRAAQPAEREVRLV